MTASPDALVATGPNLYRVPLGQLLVTPTGATQDALADLLATSTGGNVSTGLITGNVDPLLVNGLPGASGAGGAITVTSGAGDTGAGGALTLAAGDGDTSGAGGAVTISSGDGDGGAGGAISIAAGNGGGGTAAGGSIDLIPGDAVSTGAPGTLQVNSDANIIYATYYFTGTPAATDQVFFLATRAMMVVTMSEIHAVAAGGTSTMTVIKDSSTNAPGAGTSLHQSGSFNLNATANTVQNGTVSTTVATKKLAAGDRLAVKWANTVQSSAGVVVSVGLTPL